MQLKTTTYEQYLDLMTDVSALKMHEEPNLVIERFRTPQNIPSRYAPVAFMLDYTTRKYIYVDEACFNLLGYTASYFLEYGLEDYLKQWHPADFEVINNKVFPDNFNFLKKLPAEKYADIVFSYNYRFRNAEGNYVKVLQRFSYVPSTVSGKPYGMIGVVFDITYFKNDLSIVHTIEETKEINGGLVNELLFKKIHPVYEPGSLQFLSKRELEVLKYMAEGLSSKQIADRLLLSTNTVSNHRKNMLRKMNCKSSSELLSYAMKHGLL